MVRWCTAVLLRDGVWCVCVNQCVQPLPACLPACLLADMLRWVMPNHPTVACAVREHSRCVAGAYQRGCAASLLAWLRAPRQHGTVWLLMCAPAGCCCLLQVGGPVRAGGAAAAGRRAARAPPAPAGHVDRGHSRQGRLASWAFPAAAVLCCRPLYQHPLHDVYVYELKESLMAGSWEPGAAAGLLLAPLQPGALDADRFGWRRRVCGGGGEGG